MIVSVLAEFSKQRSDCVSDSTRILTEGHMEFRKSVNGWNLEQFHRWNMYVLV